ncbi:MAG: hypothetical protein NTY88_04515 [Bacteroidetes bacterium]|nr:hypothetical protein [Bacteroidota bacterium]
MILLTILISAFIARKKAKSNSDNALAVSIQNVSNNKTKTSLEQYVAWLQNTDTTALRARLAKN